MDKVGGFDETFIRNQDSELNIRLRKAGCQVWLDPRLIVEYRPRPSLRSLARQYWDYGWWRAITIHRHPDSIKLRQAAVPVAVVGLAGTVVLGIVVQPWLLLAPAAYGVSLIGAVVREPREMTLQEKATMVAALATMHVMWGTGLIASVLAHTARGWSQ